MASIYHAFICNSKLDEESIFQSFLDYLGNENIASSRVDSNPFTGTRILNLVINEDYVISLQYEEGKHLLHEYPVGNKREFSYLGRVRMLLGNDPNNKCDDIAVIVLQFLEELEGSEVYSLRGESYVPVAKFT